MTTITGHQLQEIGTEIFGKDWQKPLAESIGLSIPRVSQLKNSASISAKNTAKIAALHAQWKTTGKIEPGVIQIAAQSYTPVDEEAGFTDEQIVDRVNKRFNVMDRLVDGMMKNVIRSMIISGGPGIGKSYGLEKKLRKAHKEKQLQYTIIRGTVSAPGLYQALYQARNGGVVVLDDSDSIFNDEQAFNILKAALDSTNQRTLAWRKQSSWVYDVFSEGESDEPVDNEGRFPNEFDFEGAVVFITNLNFREIANKGTRLSPHFGALLSRSMYLDLTLHSLRSRILRIKDVFHNSMRKSLDLTEEQGDEILNYVLDNADRLDELSLRMVKHISDAYKLGDDWKENIEYTKMKTPKLDWKN